MSQVKDKVPTQNRTMNNFPSSNQGVTFLFLVNTPTKKDRRQTDRQTDSYGQRDSTRHTYRQQTYRPTDLQTYRRTDIQTDPQT